MQNYTASKWRRLVGTLNLYHHGICLEGTGIVLGAAPSP